MSGRENGGNGPRSLCIVGCGDLGQRLAARLPADWHVTGIRRDVGRLPPRIEGVAGDYSRAGGLDRLAELAPDYVVSTLKPAGRDVAGYRRGFTEATRHLLAALGRHRPRAVLMVSSTRVYGEREGAWVDESGVLSADDGAAGAIIDAERLLLDSPQTSAVLRCGGIYGDPGGRLLARIAAGEVCAAGPPRFSNRIHREDVAGFLWHLLNLREQGEALSPVYNVVDDDPAPQQQVERWLAEAMGVAVTAERPPARYHKRCRNRALTASGYRLRYPDYRAGYRAVLREREGA
jgi:nucleoside-diphosphate-sugar epimerase